MIRISPRTVRRLEEVAEILERSACASGPVAGPACGGPKRLRSMGTCRTCWALHKLRAILRGMRKGVRP